jgi:hypothetical protein
VKSEVQYCQKLVDQCRQKLLAEFDKWYSICYLTLDQQNSGLMMPPISSGISVASVLVSSLCNQLYNYVATDRV